MTEMRKTIIETMEHYRKKLYPNNKHWKVLEIGIDGDIKPGGNYQLFGIGNEYKTLDFLERLKPDYIADITDTKMPSNEWDLIICSQTLEHVFEIRKAIGEIYRMLKKGGYAIIDNPWEYPYHGLSDYGDYWRISEPAMRKLVSEAGFEIIECKQIKSLVTSLVRKV